MSNPIRIESLIPQPLPDLRRVSLILRVSGLPAYGPGANFRFLHFPDMPGGEEDDQGAHPAPPPAPNVTLFTDTSASDPAAPGDERAPSPFPDVTLSIFDPSGREVASTYIVEHKEPELDFTLHLSAAEPGAAYLARAEMRMNDEVIQTVQVAFELKEEA
ncbi:MAG: hypothetical protein Kow0063_41600 [Anaerolineae bacterium]